VHELVEKTLGDDMPNYEFYFCGPPPMTEAVQRMLMIDYKVPFEQIHFDRFF
jgi:toluene monooxygenase electron transfer component